MYELGVRLHALQHPHCPPAGLPDTVADVHAYVLETKRSYSDYPLKADFMKGSWEDNVTSSSL
jgi:hypothetical protein